MADTHGAQGSGYLAYSEAPGTSIPTGSFLKNIVNLSGAAISVGLLAGVSVWGYQLVMRDVTGIPVVRASEGAMRIRPPEPGGQLAQNTGLAVNEVAAVGEASAPADRIVLAPRPIDLNAEDRSVAEQTVAPVQQPRPLDVAASLAVSDDEAPIVDVAESLKAGNIDELVRQLAENSSSIDTIDEVAMPVPASASVQDVPTSLQVAVVDGPGLAYSMRPRLRPASAPGTEVLASATSAPAVKDIDPTSLPAGTRLVQLGAFASPDIAREQWDKLQVTFGDYLHGKDRVVQEAKSGGRTFYRLRAHGFADMREARRLCAALESEGAECVPVVTR